ncbi:8-oxo-dGTP diphosphatase [Dyella sp. OK004]|uniref:Nudix family hydrolase n=1 Tax=Dyella sp. OK004 TaxID=1855292 RepID=UPI0008E788E0|nr:Nudix family hydrolase [Dyella sp. OK004]SFS06027.1 8-oxo-dGTP diphosphatase [Dyella sp. OK004]
MIHVVAGVMMDAAGRVLLAQRPPGKHLAGLWEFPGGKLEPGEQPGSGLIRELQEELGVTVEVAEPLIRVPWQYDGRYLLLDAWMVRRWEGEVASLEGQALQWLAPSAVDPTMLAPADRPILQALLLPSRYPITPADLVPDAFATCVEMLRDALVHGERLIQLRLPLWPVLLVRKLAAELVPLARQLGATLVLNSDVEGACELGQGVGVQLRASQLMVLKARPLSLSQLVGASCHDVAELACAASLGADFATLSPVAATTSHPDAAPMGWEAFQRLVEAASLPVYALGGMQAADTVQASALGGQGVAGIRGFWGAGFRRRSRLP